LAPRELPSAPGLHRGARRPDRLERAMPATPAPYESPWVDEDVRMFRRSVRQFVEKESVPQQARWRENLAPDAGAWGAAGRAGLLLADIPEEYGGGGGSFAHEAVVLEELARAGVHFGSAIQSTVAHYLLAYGTEEQKRRWLPRMARGERVAAIAMTEPGAGSDLQAIGTRALREGEHYVVNGAKTFITNAARANLVCLAVKTDPKLAGMRAISVSTMSSEMARMPASFGSVFTALCSPSRSARVPIACRSEPAPGSVMAIAATRSPRAMRGSQRRFCSSVP